MNSKFQYDKKQLPQVMVMGILSLSLFGYFGWRMVAPPPTQAAVASTAKTSSDPSAPAAGQAVASPLTAAATTGSEVDAPQVVAIAPSPDMRDPFAAPREATQTTTTTVAPPPALPPAASAQRGPTMPPLPSIQPLSFGSLPTALPKAPAIPAPPAQPAWQVTGVIVGDSIAANHVAVLRDGDQRRYVRPGEMVDGEYRVETVDQNGVTLTRGNDKFRLTLGGSPATTKHVPAPNGASTTGISRNQDKLQPESTGKRRSLNAGLLSIME